MPIVSSSLTSSISIMLRRLIKYFAVSQKHSGYFLRHTSFENVSLMRLVLPQECTCRRRYVGHIKAHTIEAAEQTTRMGQAAPTDPPELLGMGFTVSLATPQQQWEVPAMFGFRMLQLQTFWQGCLNLGVCFLFSLSFCLFVNIVLHFHFYMYSNGSEMQYLFHLKVNVKSLLGVNLLKPHIANIFAYVHFYAKITFCFSFLWCVIYPCGWCKCFERVYKWTIRLLIKMTVKLKFYQVFLMKQMWLWFISFAVDHILYVANTR